MVALVVAQVGAAYPMHGAGPGWGASSQISAKPASDLRGARGANRPPPVRAE